jgi:hypothetical protein
LATRTFLNGAILERILPCDGAADQLTIARVASVRLVVALFAIDFSGHNYWATGVFAVAMATDWLDGRSARRQGRTSPLGSLLDPIADKLRWLWESVGSRQRAPGAPASPNGRWSSRSC